MNILITGASRGIGRAIALDFAHARQGLPKNYKHTFYCIYNKSIDEMTKVHTELSRENISFPYSADITNRRQVKETIAYFQTHGSFYIDILVNNAGILRNRTLKNMTYKEWDECLNVNLNGVFNVTKEVLPYMNQYGNIVNITSISGITGNFGQTNYSAAKAGVIGFTKSLAKELGKDRIRVNAVAVGLCETDIINDIPKGVIDSIVQQMPLKRMSTPEEVARLVRFITMEDTYSTGAVYDFTGGLI